MLKPGDATKAAAKSSSFLFLDVDGVLNTSLMAGGATVHPKLMKRLASIVEETKCGIVVSSTWRLDGKYFNVLVSELAKVGLCKESIVGSTPTVEPVRKLRQDGRYCAIQEAVELQRCQEILAWLQEHCTKDQPWVVLDDLNLSKVEDSTVIDRMQGHVVKVHPEAGLTEKNAQEAIQILGNNKDTCAESADIS